MSIVTVTGGAAIGAAASTAIGTSDANSSSALGVRCIMGGLGEAKPITEARHQRRGQNVSRTPNCTVRGSPTAVTVLNDARGFEG